MEWRGERDSTSRTKGGSGRNAAPSRNNDAEESIADVAAEVADMSEALDGGQQASRSEAALPDGLLQRRLDKTTAEKDKANAEKAKAIKDMESVQKQLEEAKADLRVIRNATVGVLWYQTKHCAERDMGFLRTFFISRSHVTLPILFIIQCC